MNTTGKVLTGFVLGATTGALLGILYAPKKGSKTRAAIADKTREMKNGLNRGFEKTKKALGLGEKPQEEPIAV